MASHLNSSGETRSHGNIAEKGEIRSLPIITAAKTPPDGNFILHTAGSDFLRANNDQQLISP